VVKSATTVVVSFPVCSGTKIRTVDTFSMWEQLLLAAFMQRHWSDNQVSSCTITFDPAKVTFDEMHSALSVYQYQLKAISFLPRSSDPNATKPYAQMPYEAIDEKAFLKMSNDMK